MKRLPLRPLPTTQEPLTDYLARLAHANLHLPADLVSYIRRQGDDCASTLSLMLDGYPLPEFSGPRHRWLNIPVNDAGLRKSDFTHRHSRFCPHCIQSSPIMRREWRLKTVTVCNLHESRLIDRCADCTSYATVQSILAGVCSCGQHYAAAHMTPVSSHIVRLTRAVIDSLDGEGVLDLGGAVFRMNAPQFVRLISYTGNLAQGPTLSRPGQVKDLEELEIAHSIVQGMVALLDDWPSSYWSCLQKFVNRSPDDGSVRRVFTPLFRVIYVHLKDAVYQPLRDAFELFLLEHWKGELCGRHRSFKLETVNAHAQQGLTTISREMGFGREPLKRLVDQARIPMNSFQGSPRRQLITVDHELVRELIPVRSECLNLRSTAELLGLKRSRVRRLVALGILSAEARPGRRQGEHWYFRRKEIERFLGQFPLPPVRPIGHVTITLNQIFRFWRLSSDDECFLFSAAQNKEIDCFLPEGARLRDLTFPERAVRRHLDSHRRSQARWVTPAVAACMLGLKADVVYDLVSRKLLAADLIPTYHHVLKRISLSSLQAFSDEFVPLKQLAKSRNMSVRTLLKQIPALPVTGPDVDGGRQYFYRRADLPSEDLPIWPAHDDGSHSASPPA